MMESNSKDTDQCQQTALQDVLYLECMANRHPILTIPSLIAAFLHRYCGCSEINVVLVDRCGPSDHQSTHSATVVRHVQDGVLRNISPGNERAISSEGCGGVGNADQDISGVKSSTASSGVETKLASLQVSDVQNVNPSCSSTVEQSKKGQQNQRLDLENAQQQIEKHSKLLEVPSCLQYSIQSHLCLPRVVQECELPCILLRSGQMCVAGLASVLRRIVQVSAPLEPHRNLISLLGFRQTCLKSCSESSVWTKLCEVDLPCEVTQLLVKDGDHGNWNIPCGMLKFQELLALPVTTFNSENLRRKLMKKAEAQEKVEKTGDGREGGGGISATGCHGNDSVKLVSNGELESNFKTELKLYDKKRYRESKQERQFNIIDKNVTNESKSVLGSKENVTLLQNGTIDSEDAGNHSCSENSSYNHSVATATTVGTRRSNRRPRNRKHIPKESLPELEHTFALGPDVTLTDFALFLPVHLTLHTLLENGRAHEARETVPLVLDWYRRMWSVPHVNRVATTLSIVEIDVLDWKVATNSSTSTQVKNDDSQSYLSVQDFQPTVGNLGVSRATVRELLKKNLPNIMTTIEKGLLQMEFADHPCISTTLDWRSFPRAVSPLEGDLQKLRARKKEQQIESIVTAVKMIARPGDRVLDFCSGGGHLGIALAYCLPNCHVIMIENKEESLSRALDRICTLELKNVTIYQSNIDYFCGHFDIGVSLHACGVATDIVVDKCLEQKASFVTSPCCYGSLHDTHHITYPRSKVFQTSDLTKKDYLLIGHGAEQTSWKFESDLAKQGKQCMGYIDLDRAELARERGYKVTLCSLQPYTCSPKNNLLVGISPSRQ